MFTTDFFPNTNYTERTVRNDPKHLNTLWKYFTMTELCANLCSKTMYKFYAFFGGKKK
jgi:hypothetical protein